MSDKFPEGSYLPEKDPELLAAIDKAMDKWKASAPGTAQTMRSKFLIVVEAQGFDDEGERVDHFMTVPGGSHEDMLGLIAGADTRFRAEIIADILERGKQ